MLSCDLLSVVFLLSFIEIVNSSCFQRHDNQTAIFGLFSQKSNIGPAGSYFNLGSFGDDVNACEIACMSKANCVVYTQYMTGYNSTEWAGTCVGSSVASRKQALQAEIDVTSGTFYVCPDIKTVDFVMELSANELYQDVVTPLDFSVTFVNIGTSRGDITAVTGLFDNFEVEVMVTDTNVGQTGVSNSLGVDPVYPMYKNPQTLMEGLPIGGTKSITVKGSAEVLVPKNKCTVWKYVCVFVKGSSKTGLIEDSQKLNNNHKCHDIATRKKCSDDHIDLSVQQFDITRSTLYSNGFAELFLAIRVDISGNFILAPNPDTVTQDYDVQLYLSDDDVISTAIDLQIKDVPFTTTQLTKRFDSSGSLFLGGPTLKLPALESQASYTKYCGLSYLGVVLDPGTGPGKINETNEYNNIMAIPVKVLCNADKWALSNVKFYTDTVHISTSQFITADMTVHNLQNTSYPGGRAAFKLALYLYDSAIYSAGSKKLELTKLGSITCPTNYSPLRAIAASGSVTMNRVKFFVSSTQFTVNQGYTHLIVKVEPTEGSDMLLSNSYFSHPIKIGTQISAKPSMTGFDIVESHLLLQGPVHNNITVNGEVNLGAINPNSLNLTIFWSKDSMLDNSDLNSGLPIAVDSFGNISLSSVILTPPTDKTFCGRVYAILLDHPAISILDISLYDDDVLAVSSKQVVLQCDENTQDKVSLMEVELLQPTPQWTPLNVKTAFSFRMRLACTATDCSSVSLAHTNFKFYLDTDRSYDGESEVSPLTSASIKALDMSPITPINLGSTSVVINANIYLKYTKASYCNANYRFMHVQLDGFSDYTANNMITIPIRLHCLRTKMMKFAIQTVTLTGSIDADPYFEVGAQYVPLSEPANTLQLPKTDWPHVDLKFYFSEDDVIDPEKDSELVFVPSQCQRKDLSRMISSSTTFTIKGNLVSPKTGFESLCHLSNVYLGVALNTRNLMSSLDIYISRKARTATISTTTLGCKPQANKKELSSAFVGDMKLPEKLYPYSTYIMNLQVKVTNEHTQDMLGTGQSSSPNFGLEMYLSGSGVVDGDSIPVDVTVNANDDSKRWMGIRAGSSVVFNILGTIPFGRMTPGNCSKLVTSNSAQMIARVVNVINGYTASSTLGSVPVSLVCYLRLLSRNVTYQHEPTVWEDLTYVISFQFELTHEGHHVNKFSTVSPNFDIKLIMMAGSKTIPVTGIVLDDPTVKTRVLKQGESMTVSGRGNFSIAGNGNSYTCADFDADRTLKLTVTPKGGLDSVGYTETEVDQDMISTMGVNCSGSWIDLSAQSITLKNAQNVEVNELEVATTVTLELKLSIGVGPTASSMFQTSATNNYDYRLYLSRTPNGTKYQIDYTPTNAQLKEAVSSTKTHSLVSASVTVPSNTDTNLLCGTVYLIAAFIDQKNKPSRKKRAALPNEIDIIQDVIEPLHPADPKLNNNILAKKIVLRCPGDLFILSGVSILSPSILEKNDASLEFSATITNSHFAGYNIPASANGLSNFNFKIYGGGTEVGLKQIIYTETDKAKSRQAIPAGGSVVLSKVKVILDVSSSFCSQISSNNWKLQVVTGVGLPSGFVDNHHSNDKLAQSGLTCNTGAYNFKAKAVKISPSKTGSSMKLTVEIDVQIDPTGQVNQLPNPALEISLNGVSFGNMATPTKTTSGNVAKWKSSLTLNQAAWAKHCGILNISLTIDPGNNVTETDESDNSINTDVAVQCDSDLYGVSFEVKTESILYPDTPTTLDFSGSVFNLESTYITEAPTGTDDNFMIKVFVQKGSVLNTIEASDITPDWRYFSDTNAPTYYRQKHDSKAAIVFNKVHSAFSVSSKVCTLGYDHLFLTVQPSSVLKLQGAVSAYEECVFYDNYVSMPFQCSSKTDGLDLAIISLRTGKKLFGLEGGNTLLLGGNVPFTLEVEIITKGSATLTIPSDGTAPFAYAFYLKDNTGKELQIPFVPDPSNVTVTMVGANKVRVGGSISLDPETFLEYCQSGGDLRVVVDPDNVIAEMDELNNEAVVAGVVVDGGAQSYCNNIDVITEKISIDPGLENDILRSEVSINYHFQYIIRKGLSSTSDPVSLSYQAVMSLDGDWNNPTNKNLTTAKTHTVANGLTVDFQEKIGVFVSSNQDNQFNHLFCGETPYIGVMIEPVSGEINEKNNLLWRQFRLECDGIDGLAVSFLKLKSTSNGAVIKSGTNIVTMQVDVLNKGTALLDSHTVGKYIFALQIYATSKNSISSELPLSVSSWVNDQPREKGMLKWSARVFDNIQATFQISHAACISMTHLCIEVIRGGGMQSSFADLYAGDNYKCYDLIKGNIKLDCGRDLSLSNFELSLPSVTKIFKDSVIDVMFNVTLGLKDQAFEANTNPYLGTQIVLSDRNTPTPTSGFNGGNPVVLVKSTDVKWNENSKQVLMNTMTNGASNMLTGAAQVDVQGKFCDSNAGARYICIKWEPLINFIPPIRDTNSANDYQCLDASQYLDCTQDTVDLKPVQMDLGNGIGVSNNFRHFNIEVEVNIGSSAREGKMSFATNMYLSLDKEIDELDMKLESEGFKYGLSSDEMKRHLKTGKSIVNIGFDGILIPGNLVTPNVSLCGDMFVIAKIDSDNKIVETDENNNIITSPLTTVCVDDSFLLADVSLDMNGKTLYAEEETELQFDMTVMNMKNQPTPVPSPSQPNYWLKVQAVWSVSGKEQMSDISTPAQVTFPEGYFRQMMALERVRYRGVKAKILPGLFTIPICRAVTKLRFTLVPTTFDNKMNHEVTVNLPMTYKKCNPATENTQLQLNHYNTPQLVYLPAQVNLGIGVTSKMWIGAASGQLQPKSFITTIYVSRDRTLDQQNDYKWRVLESTQTINQGFSSVDLSTVLALQTSDAGQQYCGHTHIFTVIDSDNDLIEPREEGHSASRETAFICDNDYFGISDVTLKTHDQQIVEGRVMTFELRTKVTCTKKSCNLAGATEYIKLKITSKLTNAGSEAILSTITSQWGGAAGESISPTLGSSYLYTGYQNDFVVKGSFNVGSGGCSSSGENFISVKLEFGSDLLAAVDAVTENNVFSFKYKCIKPSPVDLILTGLNFLSGETFTSEKHSQFHINIKLDPEMSSPVSIKSPFKLGFSLSVDAMPSPEDYWLNYEMSDCVAGMVREGFLNKTTVDLYDYKGLFIPNGFCGEWYVIGQIDSTNVYTETSEDNNYLAKLIDIKCKRDILAVDVQTEYSSIEVFYNTPVTTTMDMSIRNLGKETISGCTLPCQQLGLVVAFSGNDVLEPYHDEILDVKISQDHQKKLQQEISPSEVIHLKSMKVEVVLPASKCFMYKYLLVGVLFSGEYNLTEDVINNNIRAVPMHAVCTVTPDLRFQPSAALSYLFEKEDFMIMRYVWQAVITVPPNQIVAPFMVQLWLSDDPLLDKAQDVLLGYQLGSGMNQSFAASQVVPFSTTANTLRGADQYKKYCNHAYIIGDMDPHGDITESNRENNIVADAIEVSCFQKASSNTVALIDLFILKEVTMDLVEPGDIWPDQQYLMRMNITVECKTQCPTTATSDTLSFPIHYILELKVYDQDLKEVGLLDPAKVDGYWISGAAQDDSPLTYFTPSDGLQADFTKAGSLSIELQGMFAVKAGSQCGRVKYLGVSLKKGDSKEVLAKDWGITQNDIKYVPWVMKCEQDPFDLMFQTLTINGQGETGSTVTLDLNTVSTINLGLVISSGTGNWPKTSDGDMMFDVKLYATEVKSMMADMYELYPTAPLTALTKSVIKGGTVTLSDSNAKIHKSNLARICGKGPVAYIAAVIDVYNEIEESNKKNNVAFIKVLVTGCQVNFDLVLDDVGMPEFIASGSNMAFQIDNTFTYTGSGVTIQMGDHQSVQLKMQIYDDSGKLIRSLKPEVESAVLNNTALISAANQVISASNNYTGVVKIPEEYMYCDHSWLLKTEVQWTGLKDNNMMNNIRWKQLYIGCPADGLALTSYELGLNISAGHFTWWPILEIEVPLRVTVKNTGSTYRHNATVGTFGVEMYFSVDDVLSRSTDHKTTAKLKGSDFLYSEGVNGMSSIQTDWLTGALQIPTNEECIEASQFNNATPTLFIAINVPDPSLSVFTGNDAIRIPLEKSIFKCVEGQVDLSVSKFSINKDPVPPNTDLAYTLKIGIRKSSAGKIADADPTKPNDVSIGVTMYLSVDNQKSSDDVEIPVKYTTNQLLQLRQGVPAALRSPGEYTVDGENFNINIDDNPHWQLYCGQSYVLVIVADLKNNPPVDSNNENNMYKHKIYIQCLLDTIALSDFSLTPIAPQDIIYSGLDVMVDFKAAVWSYEHSIAKSKNGHANFHLKLYMSPDRSLNLDLDSEVSLKSVGSAWNAKLMEGLPKSTPMNVEGQVVINIPLSACTSRYLILSTSTGVDYTAKDNVIPDNIRYVDIGDNLKCSVDYVDFSIKSFSLPSGDVIKSGQKLPFKLAVTIEMKGSTVLGSGKEPVYKFQFFLSKDKKFNMSEDINLNFTGADQATALTNTFTGSIDMNMDSTKEMIMVPLVSPDYCGKVYILTVVDVDRMVVERSEYNNVNAHLVTLTCDGDALSLYNVSASVPDMLYKNWASVQLSLTVHNLLSTPLSGNNKPVFDIRVYAMAKPGYIMHDITPTKWMMSGQTISTNLAAGGGINLESIIGSIDITPACWPAATFQWLNDGPAYLVIEVSSHKDIIGVEECVMDNNIYIMDINVNCGTTKQTIDFSATSLALDSGNTLKLAANGITFKGSRTTTGVVAASAFGYTLTVSAGGLERLFDGTSQTADGEFLIKTSSVLDLSSDSQFLCSYSGAITVTAVIDRHNDVIETNEMNNKVTITGLSVDPAQCTNGIDISAESLMLSGTDLVHKPKVPLKFDLKAAVTAIGTSSISALSGDSTHFTWTFVLSHDDVLDPSDYTFAAGAVSATQKAQLQVAVSQGSTKLLTLDGSNLVIPLDKKSQPYCWKHPYLGVILDSGKTLAETNENNNVKFYRIILDCGDKVDECTENLANCSVFADCKDVWFNLTTYIGQPYTCTCKKGFEGDGKVCTDKDECSGSSQLCSGITHSVCQNFNGGYECQCKTGYKPTVDTFGDISSCTDLDECSNSSLYTCHGNASCVNTDGAYTCQCDKGFTGDGVQNCTDITDCQADSCRNNGTCVEGLLGFTCKCLPGYDGPRCDMIHGSWSEWTAWSDCMAQCGNGFAKRTRQCNNPAPKNDGRPCSRQTAPDQQHTACKVKGCYTGHIPWKNYNPCFDQAGSGVTLYSEFGKAYTCGCAVGYKMVLTGGKFTRCEDNNECTMLENGYKIHDCHDNATCVNKPGTFTCVCKSGYEGNGRDCKDKNECSSGNPCPPNADCMNTEGSFQCTCKTGYKVEDVTAKKLTCLEERLLPYGSSTGDSEVTTDQDLSTLTKERASKTIKIPHGLAVGEGQLANSLYISENGLVVITDDTVERTDSETYRFPVSLDDKVFDGSAMPVKGFLAPFWADTDSNSRFYKVWYKSYTDMKDPVFGTVKQLLSDGLKISFDAQYILKVTWSNMAPTYASDTSERNTFQLVLATDGCHTYSVYIYDEGGMRWKPGWMFRVPELMLVNQGFPARVGFAVKSMNGPVHGIEDANSAKWSVFDNENNAYRVSEKVMQSHGKKGFLFYQLDNNTSDFINPMKKCQAWFDSEGDIKAWSSDIVHTCPQNNDMASHDNRFELYAAAGSASNLTCYNRVLPNKHGSLIRCCYMDEDGSLIDAPLATNYDDIGFLSRYQYSDSSTSDYYQKDVSPYKYCVSQSNTHQYTDMYMSKRPVMTAKNYQNVKSAWAQGSVHMMTLDGAKLDILGYGEYVWLRSKPGSQGTPIMVQLRTDMSTYQATSKAVIISGVAAKVGTGVPSIQAYLNSAGDGIDVWVDNQVYTNQKMTNAKVLKPGPSGRPKRSTKDTVVTFLFEAGISLTIYVFDKQLAVVIQVPANLKDVGLDGLLGNMDGVVSNDFSTEAGDVFNTGSTASELFSYTQTWQLRNLYGATNADANTIFHHYTNPTSANNYFKAGFSPDFYTAADYTSQQTAACTVTGTVSWECAYDYKVTGRSSLAVQQIQNSNKWGDVNTMLRNVPPVFDQNTPELVEADAGVSKKLTIKASDDQQVTFGITVVNLETMTRTEISPTSTTNSGNLYTAVFFWTPGQYKTHLIFHAKDTTGARVTMTPVFSLCDCKHKYQCDHKTPTYYLGNFRYGLCKCIQGYSGAFCDQDMQGCKIRHCYGKCSDKTPQQVAGDYLRYEFTCNACPNGMEGDGITCTDVNECVLPSSDLRKHKCQQTCTNTAGGYECGCNPGYILNHDLRTCSDVKECNTTVDNCDKVHGTCRDGNGTFACGCQAGFKLASDNVTCVDIDECATNNGNCARLCINTAGSYRCECGYGYTADVNNKHNCLVADLCKSDPYCDHQCNNLTAMYDCSCNTNYIRQQNFWECKPKFPCTVNSCDNLNGVCAVSNGQTICSCVRGKQLSSDGNNFCQDINECTTGAHACGQNTICTNKEETGVTYSCVCKNGYKKSSYSDKECVNIDECQESNGASLCSQICTDSPGSYICDCYRGYILAADNRTCIDIDECAAGIENKCDINADCTNSNGSYSCKCKAGYTGNGYMCDELDECSLDNGGCGQVCHNTQGSYYCSCLPGYMLEMNRKTCVDINECTKPSTPCQQSCVNTAGGYNCTCWSGYTLNSNGYSCDIQQPCSASQTKWCGNGGVCSVASGKPVCACNSGYVLNGQSGICDDTNECTTVAGRRRKRSVVNNNATSDLTTDTPTTMEVTTVSTTTTTTTTTTPAPKITYLNKCGAPTALCSNTDGSYTCQCLTGYKLRGDGLTCMDIDECTTPDTSVAHRCDVNSTKCVNTLGSYSCNCMPGFRFDTKYKCRDINECDADDVTELTCSKQANCVNNPGTFTCSCKSGYSGDGVTCRDVDECKHSTLSTCSVNQTCVNTNGSFDCPCKPGYKKQVNNPSICLDINECDSTSLNYCLFGCENLVGSFRCTCPSGYQLNPVDGRSCEIAQKCDSLNMRKACQQDCIRQNDADYCRCYPGYTKDNLLCHDINECTETDAANKNKCGIHSQCKNTNGSYECVCDRYYIPDSDGLACSRTDGNWGAWSNWNDCSQKCNGRRTKTRQCNAPEPTIGRNCKGTNVHYALCNYDMPKCYSLLSESEKSVFVDFVTLVPELWESVSPGFKDGVCKTINLFCWESADNYQKCCNKPLSDPSVLQLRRVYCKEEYIKLGQGYPRDHNQGSRIMVYIEMPLQNPLCGLMEASNTRINVTVVNAGRKKRDTSQASVYTMPRDFLQERLDANETRGNVTAEVAKRYDSAVASAMFDYNLEPSYHEDEQPPTEPPVVESNNLNIVVVILAVLFSIIGICVLAIVLFLLVRPAPKELAAEDGVKGTALQMFEQKDEEEVDSEDEAIRKVFERENTAYVEDGDDDEEDDEEDDDSELDIERKMMSPQSIMMEDRDSDEDDETAIHPNRPMSKVSQRTTVSSAGKQRTVSRATYQEITEGNRSSDDKSLNEADGNNDDRDDGKAEDQRSKTPQNDKTNENQSEPEQPESASKETSEEDPSTRPNSGASQKSTKSNKSQQSGSRPSSEISNHSSRDTLL